MHYLREWKAGVVEERPLRDRETFVCPRDHAHDLKTCWRDHGCRCDRCRHLRKMERQRNRNRMRAYGRPITAPRVPLAPVYAHVVELMAHTGLERIADAAQVSRSALLDIYFGRRGAEQRHLKRPVEERTVRASLADRIMALSPADVAAALVPSTGTVRRLRALVTIGYSESELAARLGMLVSNFSGIILDKRARVTAETYTATCALFAELWSTPKAGATGDRTRAFAKSKRWVGPLAWDDIDDPTEVPNSVGVIDEEPALDEVAIEQAMLGRPVKLRHAERREAITRLHARHWSNQRIAQTLGIADRTVLRIRQELGLLAFDYADLRKAGAA